MTLKVELKELTAEEFGQMVLQLTAPVQMPVGAWEQGGAFMLMATAMAQGSLVFTKVKDSK